MKVWGQCDDRTMKGWGSLMVILIGALVFFSSAWQPGAGAAMDIEDEENDETPALEDADYDAGVLAFDAENWTGVVEHLTKVVDRQPGHADAYSLLGFAYRKLGDFDHSLAFYDKALTLDPDHLGALEYLGEAYLDLGRPEETLVILGRLEDACKRVVAPEAAWQSACEEWAHINAAYQAHRDGRPRPEHD